MVKPKDLPPPFKWESRRPIFAPPLFFVPDYYDAHDQFDLPSWQEIFKNDRPVCIEYCSGNGAWVIERAKNEPQFNWVAVEKRFDRVRKIWSKAQNEKVDNLLVIWGYAQTVIENYFLDRKVNHVFINFPDPWPKDRHAKHRLLQTGFVDQLHGHMAESGELWIATDDTHTAQNSIGILLDHPGFQPLLQKPYFVCDWPSYGSSYFLKLWETLGRKIHFIHFKKGTERLAYARN